MEDGAAIEAVAEATGKGGGAGTEADAADGTAGGTACGARATDAECAPTAGGETGPEGATHDHASVAPMSSGRGLFTTTHQPYHTRVRSAHFAPPLPYLG